MTAKGNGKNARPGPTISSAAAPRGYVQVRSTAPQQEPAQGEQAERQIAAEHDQPRRPGLDQLGHLSRQDRDSEGSVPVHARHQHGVDEGDQESH